MLKVVAVVHLLWCFFVLPGLSWYQSLSETDEVTDGAHTHRALTLFDSGADDMTQKLRDRRQAFGVEKWEPDTHSATVSPELIRRYRTRQRTKQARIFQILLNVKDMTGVNNTLGFNKTPVNNGLDFFQKRLVQSHEMELENEDADSNKRIMHTILLPSCQATALGNRSSREFRLFFNIVPPERILRPESIVVKSASLLLKRKPLSELKLNGKLKVNEDRKFKKRNRNYSIDYIDNWKVRIHSYNRSKKASKKALKSVHLNTHNSTEWLKIGLLKVVEGWYRIPIRNPGLQVTVVNGKDKPVDPFQVFYAFSCDLSKPSPAMADGTSEAEQGIGADRRTDDDRKSRDIDDDITNFPHLEVVTMAIPNSRKKKKVPTATLR